MTSFHTYSSAPEATVLFTLRLTPFQAEEVEHGLEVDIDSGNAAWGTVERRGKTVRILHVYDVEGAIYRVTSARDIAQDNTDFDRSAAAHARSLDSLTAKLVEAAGGLDAIPEQTRRWI